jgi:hypothetical protein
VRVAGGGGSGVAYCLDLTRTKFGFIGLLDDDGDEMMLAAIKAARHGLL